MRGKTLDSDIRWLEEGFQEVSWESIVERYREPLKKFYQGMLEDLRNVDREGIKPGNRRYKSRPFEKGLAKLFGKVLGNEDIIDESCWLTVKDSYKSCFSFGKRSKNGTKMEVDIGIPKKITTTKNHNMFYIEAKYNLDMNEFGSALMKSILTEKEENSRFYIVSLRREGKCDYRELCKKEPFKRYIDGVVYFGPKYDPELRDVVKLLQENEESFSRGKS